MKHRHFPILIAFAAFLVLCAAPARARTVLLVVSADDPYDQKIAASFKKTYSGILDETNLFGLEDRSRQLGTSLADNPPRLLVAVGDLAARTAKQYCANCPVLYAAASNPDGINLSGPNVYGISNIPSPAKMMENVKLAFPEVKNVGLIYQPKNTGKLIAPLQAAASKSGLALNTVPIEQMKEVPKAFDQLANSVDLLLLLQDPGVITTDTLHYLFINCIKKKIPVFVSNEDLLRKCGVAGYGLDPEQLGAELAGLASDIMRDKVAGSKVRSENGSLLLKKKIAQMYNYNFSAQATSVGISMQ